MHCDPSTAIRLCFLETLTERLRQEAALKQALALPQKRSPQWSLLLVSGLLCVSIWTFRWTV